MALAELLPPQGQQRNADHAESPSLRHWSESQLPLDDPRRLAADVNSGITLLRTLNADANARLPYLRQRATRDTRFNHHRITDQLLINAHISSMFDAYQAQNSPELRDRFEDHYGNDSYFYLGAVADHKDALEADRNQSFSNAETFDALTIRRTLRGADAYVASLPKEQTQLLWEKTGYLPSHRATARPLHTGLQTAEGMGVLKFAVTAALDSGEFVMEESIAAAVAGGAVYFHLLGQADWKLSWAIAAASYIPYGVLINANANQAYEALSETGLCANGLAKTVFEYGKQHGWNEKKLRRNTKFGYAVRALAPEAAIWGPAAFAAYWFGTHPTASPEVITGGNIGGWIAKGIEWGTNRGIRAANHLAEEKWGHDSNNTKV